MSVLVMTAMLVTCAPRLDSDQFKALQKNYGKLQRDVLQFQKNQTNLERKFSYDLKVWLSIRGAHMLADDRTWHDLCWPSLGRAQGAAGRCSPGREAGPLGKRKVHYIFLSVSSAFGKLWKSLSR